MSSAESPHTWPGDTLTRVPYWVYQDEANYRTELRRIFEGPVWSYVCLESDVERPGDFRTTFVGEMPVVVVRSLRGPCSSLQKEAGMPPRPLEPFSKAMPVRLPRRSYVHA